MTAPRRAGRQCALLALAVLLMCPAAAGAQSDIDSSMALWVASIDGTGARKIADGVHPGFTAGEVLSWSPDSRQIAYTELHSQGVRPGGIYTVGIAGGKPRRLIPNGATPAWSPGGDAIAYTGPVPNWIMLRDLASGTTTTLVAHGTDPDPGATGWIVAAGGPVWSPDGSLIAFTAEATRSDGRPGASGIWVVNRDGTGRRPAVSGATDDGSFQTLVPHSFRTSGTIRFKAAWNRWDEAALDGSSRVPIPLPAGASQPNWSRQGHLVAYVTTTTASQTTGSRNPPIHVADAAGASGTKVTTGMAPVISPDASKIAFLRRLEFESRPLPTAQPLTITRIRGTVRYKPPGRRERRLTGTRKLRADTIIDVTQGKIRANAGGGSWRGTLSGGEFRAARASSLAPIARLHLHGRLAACARNGKQTVRRLSGSTRGYLAVEAKAATVNPTEKSRWTVSDRCDGSTLTTAQNGKVIVRVRGGRDVVLRGGRSYLARRERA